MSCQVSGDEQGYPATKTPKFIRNQEAFKSGGGGGNAHWETFAVSSITTLWNLSKIIMQEDLSDGWKENGSLKKLDLL